MQRLASFSDSTSSAFSVHRNPSEDWTKISDSAERRRVQNRIAQRNYRKKLKKRLEDLERRAGSSSASAKPNHEEVAPPEPPTSSDDSPQFDSQRRRSNVDRFQQYRTPEVLQQEYVLPSDDRAMFSQQYTRQMSTSPPLFSCNSISTVDSVGCSSHPRTAVYCGMLSNGMDMSLYLHYQPPLPHNYEDVVASIDTQPNKQQYYADDEINPFNMSHASMANVDIFYAQGLIGTNASADTAVV